jgi:hypothetical protein
MRNSLLDAQTLLAVLCAAWMPACASALHPHTTLAGQYFPSARTTSVFGFSFSDRPEWDREALVTFRSDRVTAIDVSRQADAP